MLRWIIALGLLTLLAACQSMPPAESPTSAVVHFVAVWLKDPADAAARERIEEKVEQWRDYPGVLSSECGPALPGTRAVVQDYDLGVLMVFASEAALRQYEQDEAHQQAVREILAPAAAKVQVYDFLLPAGTKPGVDRSTLRDRQYQHYQQFAN